MYNFPCTKASEHKVNSAKGGHYNACCDQGHVGPQIPKMTSLLYCRKRMENLPTGRRRRPEDCEPRTETPRSLDTMSRVVHIIRYVRYSDREHADYLEVAESLSNEMECGVDEPEENRPPGNIPEV